MLASILAICLSGSALYSETNIAIPFSVGDKVKLRGYAFYQEIAMREYDEPHRPFAVGRLEDPYEFTPSRLRVFEIGIVTAHIDSAFYYSEIDIGGVGRFNYAGTRTRLDIPLTKDFGLYAQSAHTLFRNTPAAGDTNVTLGARWRWIEADWTFGDIGPVQSDDQYFQGKGLHLRASFTF